MDHETLAVAQNNIARVDLIAQQGSSDTLGQLARIPRIKR